MNLSEPFIRRPVMTAVLTVSAIVFGVLAYFSLPVNDLPAVDYPVIQVNVGYPGATPETMANNVATPLERSGHVVGHGFWRCARIADVYLNDGIVDRGQIVDRQGKISEYAKNNGRHREHCGHHRAANKWFREIHRSLFSLLCLRGRAGLHARRGSCRSC